MRELIATICIAGAAAFIGCAAHGSPLKTADSVPAAEASVNASEGENGNTKLEVEVEHLAPPGKVADGAAVYVVWARPHAGDPKPTNLGALHVDDDRKGKLDTTTPLRSFDVLVTPESSAQVTEPTHDPVLTGKVER